MLEFHHNRLIVYRKAMDFVGVTAVIIVAIDGAYGFLRDQLGRAATSILLNIAEGSGEFSRPEKARFYRMARRSVTESAAILDALEAVGFRQPGPLETGRSLLHEIIAMLTVMTRPADATSPEVVRPRKPGPRQETGA